MEKAANNSAVNYTTAHCHVPRAQAEGYQNCSSETLQCSSSAGGKSYPLLYWIICYMSIGKRKNVENVNEESEN